MNSAHRMSSFFRQLPLDIALAVAVMALLLIQCIQGVNLLVERAYLSGVITMMGSEGRVRIVERIAMQGVLSDPTHMHQPVTVTSDAYLSPNARTPFAYADQGGGTLATGRLNRLKPQGALTPQAALSIHAIAPEGQPGWSVMWQCGHYKPPNGWSTPAPVQVDNLVRTHLPSVCKSNLAP